MWILYILKTVSQIEVLFLIFDFLQLSHHFSVVFLQCAIKLNFCIILTSCDYKKNSRNSYLLEYVILMLFWGNF